MTIDTNELRRLAEAARDSNRDEPGELPYDLTLTPEDQELILALSPTTILALLDRLAAAEAALEGIKHRLQPVASSLNPYTRTSIALDDALRDIDAALAARKEPTNG